MLSNYMVDNGHMGAIVEGDALLAVVDIEVIRNNVLAHYKAVFKALYRNVAQLIIIVLILRGNKSCNVAGVGLKLFTVEGVAYLFVKTELRIANVYSRHVAEIYRSLSGIHLVLVQRNCKLKVMYGKIPDAEFSCAGVTYRR